MKNQVLSIEQMRHLQELGVDTSKASMCWLHLNLLVEEWVVSVNDSYARETNVELVPTFTLQDIIELLPDSIKVGHCEYAELSISNSVVSYMIEYDYDGSYAYKAFNALNGENVLELCFQMLCWCAENGYLNKNKAE